MSYILDALRKADAERERDPARGIHAQPAVPVPARASPGAGRWAWGAVAAGVAVAAGYLGWPQSPAAPTAVAAAPAAPPPMPEAAPAPAPAVVTAATSVLPPAPPPLPAPVVRAAPAPAKAASAPAAAAPAPAAASDRILAIAELPADVQRELPKLAISGGVHSENAAQRLLIVGGQVVNEGAQLAPGLVLEQIRARSAVLRFRGFRYSVPF